MNQNNRIIIRCDADSNIGAGHLMRCLALGEYWKSLGGKTIFVTATKNEQLVERLHNENFQVIQLARAYPDPADWVKTSQVITENPNTWVILDGYHFDPSYQLCIKEAGSPLMIIDDMAHLNHYYADIILNQNINATQLNYSCEPRTRFLFGTQYVLLRREFHGWEKWQREIPKNARRVLVTLGGSDPDRQTLKAIRAIKQVKKDDLEVTVIVGASNAHFNEIKTMIRDLPFNIRIVRNALNMPKLMAWADLALSAGGSTNWELAFMGLPSMAIVLAENQKGIAEGLAKDGIVLNLGWFRDVTENHISRIMTDLLENSELRREMSRKGRQLVDNAGSNRVLSTLCK